jgi:hypothetical protein
MSEMGQKPSFWPVRQMSAHSLTAAKKQTSSNHSLAPQAADLAGRRTDGQLTPKMSLGSLACSVLCRRISGCPTVTPHDAIGWKWRATALPIWSKPPC